jgi:aerobic-type carbon monoxide dehydrogenase small subunit (CoxS/CutS family)
MVLAAKSLLDRIADPTLDDVRHALSGNLCRCTGYMRIFEAVLAAKSLLDRVADPTLDEVRHALAGNLCRCTGSMRIFEAVLAAVKPGAPKPPANSTHAGPPGASA